MWFTLFVRSSHRRFHLLLHWATSLQIWLHPETSCRHWESKFLARVLKSSKSMNMQEGGQQNLIKPQSEEKKTRCCFTWILLCFVWTKIFDIMFFSCSLTSYSPVKSLFVTLQMGFCLWNYCGFMIGFNRIRQNVPSNTFGSQFVFCKTCRTPIFHHIRQGAQTHGADNSSGGFDHKNLHHR